MVDTFSFVLSILADRYLSAYFYVQRFIKFWRCFSISKQELLINEEIKCKEVRLVGPDGDPLGITSAAEALDTAYAKNLDLVLIAPKAEPPVCKIMDYGKYKFELAKRDKEAKKNQKVMTLASKSKNQKMKN